MRARRNETGARSWWWFGNPTRLLSALTRLSIGHRWFQSIKPCVLSRAELALKLHSVRISPGIYWPHSLSSWEQSESGLSEGPARDACCSRNPVHSGRSLQARTARPAEAGVRPKSGRHISEEPGLLCACGCVSNLGFAPRCLCLRARLAGPPVGRPKRCPSARAIARPSGGFGPSSVARRRIHKLLPTGSGLNPAMSPKRDRTYAQKQRSFSASSPLVLLFAFNFSKLCLAPYYPTVRAPISIY